MPSLMPLSVVALPAWRARAAAHQARVDGWLAGHLERRRAGRQHPVEDFLFTYYSHRPAQLRRWRPGIGVVLDGADPVEFGPDYVGVAGEEPPASDSVAGGGLTLDVGAVLPRRRETVTWIRDLLMATASRPPVLGCFGMHEWAMVYRQPQDQIRHDAWPLRLGAGGTDAVVEGANVRCSHFDAYRFFTPPARPLNQLQPTRDTQLSLEQPGCLHANMDVYRWAYKLSPFTSSELVADCFALAREIRTVDMRASPYDLAGLGYPPVRVETADGRAEYVVHQRDFAQRAAVLRTALIACCETVLAQ